MRISDRTIFTSASSRLQRRTTELNRSIENLSDGIEIRRPSDDAVRFERGRAAKQRGTEIEAFTRAANTVTVDLNTADGALMTMQNTLMRIAELTVQGASEQHTDVDRSAMALEIDSLFDHLVAMANSNVAGRHLFGGTAEDSPPFDVTGTYQGSNQVVRVELADGDNVTSRFDGSSLFASNGTTVFAIVDDIRNALRANDTTTLQTNVDLVFQAVRDMGEAQAIVGAESGHAQQSVIVLEASAVNNEAAIENAVSADYVKEASNMALTQRALEGLQQIIPKTLNMGLLRLPS